MKIKITYIISNIDKALAFEWVPRFLNKEKFDLSFILLNPAESELEDFLISHNIPFLRVTYQSKRNLLKAFFSTYHFLKKNKTQIVHTHLFEANLIGLLAAKFAGIKKRIHTRHYSTIHHVYHPSGVKYDRLINYLSTDIVAISEVTKKVLIDMEGVKKNKIKLIHHGFNFSEIPSKNSDRVHLIREKYKLNASTPVIGVISRYIHLKGIQYIIPAFERVLEKHPKAKLVLANTNGSYREQIKSQLEVLSKDSFLEIKFERDVFALYQSFDVFVHVPIDELSEAFGQTYIESLASGIPSVFTLSGIAVEVMKHKENCLLVDYKNEDQIFEAIDQLLSKVDLQERIIKNGKELVLKGFGIMKMIENLESLYLTELGAVK